MKDIKKRQTNESAASKIWRNFGEIIATKKRRTSMKRTMLVKHTSTQTTKTEDTTIGISSMQVMRWFQYTKRAKTIEET